MLIRTVPTQYVCVHVRERVESLVPMFVSFDLNLSQSKRVPLYFLLDWWNQYQTYIARQVLPDKDKNGKDTYRFVSPLYNVSMRRLIKRRLREIYGVRHVAYIQNQASDKEMLIQLGGHMLPPPILLLTGNRSVWAVSFWQLI